MRRLVAFALVIPVALVLSAGLLLAGGPNCGDKAAAAVNTAHAHKKCTMDKGDCMKMMAEAKSRGWMGIELEESDSDGTWSITKVVTGSPASAAGFREGDVLLALNGVTLTPENHEKLAAIKKTMKAGDRVTYNVRRGGSEQNIAVTLGTMPDEVYSAWTKDHLKEHAEVASR